MIEYVIKSPEGRIVVVPSRQKSNYIKRGYVQIATIDMANDEVKGMIKRGYTKDEVFAKAVENRLKLEKRTKNGKDYFFAEPVEKPSKLIPLIGRTGYIDNRDYELSDYFIKHFGYGEIVPIDHPNWQAFTDELKKDGVKLKFVTAEEIDAADNSL